jgi:low affinity Fe/Cu permease
VKIDAELIINICENSSVTIQPVTPTEISKLVATLKNKKAEDIDNLTSCILIRFSAICCL